MAETTIIDIPEEVKLIAVFLTSHFLDKQIHKTTLYRIQTLSEDQIGAGVEPKKLRCEFNIVAIFKNLCGGNYAPVLKFFEFLKMDWCLLGHQTTRLDDLMNILKKLSQLPSF